MSRLKVIGSPKFAPQRTRRSGSQLVGREKPRVPSQLSECLGAGTGCRWCVPFLKKLFEQWQQGEEPNLPVSPETYARRRLDYHKSGRRDADAEQGM